MKDRKRLKKGYTTGTCAQGATKAGMEMLLTGKLQSKVEIELPQKQKIKLDILEVQWEKEEDLPYPNAVTCAVRKDSGDDPDVTNGILIFSRVSWRQESGIEILGGIGVGRVTRKGLNQPIGEAAINKVPRSMIEREVLHACNRFGVEPHIQVEIFIPEGEALAKKTFNPKLGIQGGLSILGTTGILEPMSEQALVDTIEVEIRVKKAEGRRYLLVAPGNYGLEFLKTMKEVEESQVIKCSNFFGDTIDLAENLGMEGMVFVGHIGKVIKLSGGIMNTHSKWADCRMELLAAAAIRGGVGRKAEAILSSRTTEEALGFLTEEERFCVMEAVMERIHSYLEERGKKRLRLGCIAFSNQYGILGYTREAKTLFYKAIEGKE